MEPLKEILLCRKYVRSSFIILSCPSSQQDQYKSSNTSRGNIITGKDVKDQSTPLYRENYY